MPDSQNNNSDKRGDIASVVRTDIKPPPFDTMGFVRFEVLLWASTIFWVIPLFILLRWGVEAFRYLIVTIVKEHLWTMFVLVPIGLLITCALLVWGVWSGVAYLLALI